MAESFKKFNQYLSERYKGVHATDAPPLSEPHADPHAKAYYAPNVDNKRKPKMHDDANNVTPLGHTASPGFGKPSDVQSLGQKVERPSYTDSKKSGRKKTKGRMKSESFLSKTSEMSDAEFTRYMLNKARKVPQNAISDVYGEQFVPEPTQTMRYVASLMLTDESMMRRMVRELKRNDGLHALLKELLQHPEVYSLFSEAVENGSFGERAQAKLMQIIERAVMQPRWGASTGGGINPNPAGGMGGAGGMPGMNPAPSMPGQPSGAMGMAGQGEGEEMMDPNAMGGMGGDPNAMGGMGGDPNAMGGMGGDPNAMGGDNPDDEGDEGDDEHGDDEEDDEFDDEDEDDEDEDDDEDDDLDGDSDPHQHAKDKHAMQTMQANNMGPGMPGMPGMGGM